MRADAWLLDVTEESDPGAADITPLDAHERERAAAFRRPVDRHLYTVAHLALRTLLAGLLGARPADLVFGREPCPCCGAPHGRPVLATPGPPPLHFSLSHTPGLVLVATAPVPVGADVEHRPAPESVRDLVSVLHPRERAEIEGEPEGEPRAAALGRIWARKEAYLKGLGTGLGRDPALDDLGGDPVREPGRHPEGWAVRDLLCGPRHHGAVALRTLVPGTKPAPGTGTGPGPGPGFGSESGSGSAPGSASGAEPRLRRFPSLAALRAEPPAPLGE
ncbi:4'-phosphopantetheinyl transferase family protein [Streptomyces sp. NPDC048718]|uniref:4'-phosphopantetheinyl transferase family protein n=1 Tax=Streptomyces sp. NPDC048718 TaxID=3365587 RepID=UPI0037246BC2